MGPQTPSESQPAGPYPIDGTTGGAPDSSTRQDRLVIWVVGGVVLILLCAFASVGCLLAVTLPTLVASVNAPALRTATAATGETRQPLPSADGTVRAQVAQATATAASRWPLSVPGTFQDDGNDWFLGDVNNAYWSGNVAIINSAYRWEGNPKQGFFWTEAPRMNSLSALSLTVDAQQSSGSPEDEYGLFFRWTGQDWYYFSVNGYQIFNLWLKHNGDWKRLVPATRTSAIRPGQMNRLSVQAEGTHITLFINDQYVGEVNDGTLSKGRAGLGVSASNGSGHFVFTFENFEVRSTEGYATGTAMAESTLAAQSAQAAGTFAVQTAQETVIARGAEETTAAQAIHATSTALALRMVTEQAAAATATNQAGSTATVEAARSFEEVQAQRTATALLWQATATAISQWPLVQLDYLQGQPGPGLARTVSDQSGTWKESIVNHKSLWDIQALKDGGWSESASLDSYGSFSVIMEARLVSGPKDVRFGMILRQDANGNYYQVSLAEDQTMVFGLYNNGILTNLMSLQGVTAIHAGDVNRLAVGAIGSHFIFFVNDQYIGEAEDDSVAGGTVGPAVWLSGGENASVEFDHFELRSPQ